MLLDIALNTMQKKSNEFVFYIVYRHIKYFVIHRKDASDPFFWKEPNVVVISQSSKQRDLLMEKPL